MNHTTKRTRTVLGVVLTAAILVLTACGSEGDSDKKASDEPSSQESSSTDKSDSSKPSEGPDLTGIPDVVAEVNGEELTKDDFVPAYEAQYQQAAAQAQMGGQQPDEESLKKSTADNLVETELLRQEADSRGISATDEDVDGALTDLAKQNQLGSADELLAALEKQGTSEELARSQVEVHLMVERLVEDETGPIKPTDAELHKVYDAAVAQQKAAGKQSGQQPIPPFAKVRSQIVEQVKSDKEGKAAQELVDNLKKDADITINL